MNRLNRSLLAAAVSGVLVSGTFAQIRVDRSGATDANTRVGSGGRHTVGARSNPWEISNRVVYGNVTGGKAFSGPTASTDPQAFRGPSGSFNTDRFVRESSGVTTGGVATYNANQTRAYYGDSRNVAPPAGFVGIATTGGYTPPTPTAWSTPDVRGRALSSPDTAVVYNPPGQFGGPGEVSSIYAPNLPTLSQVGQGGLAGREGLSDYTNLNTNTISQFTPGQIKQMQGDEPQSRLPGQTPQDGTTNNVNVDAQPQQVGSPGSPANGGPLNVPQNNAQEPTPNSNLSGAVPLNNSVTSAAVPEVGTVTRLTPKAGQPTQANRAGDEPGTAALNTGPRRPGQAAEEAARQFNAQMRAQKNNPDGTNADATGGNAAEAKAPADAAQPADNRPAGGPPPKVGTFAGAATEKGLTELLTKAEGQMKEGKYATAIDTYGAAEAVSPRNATVKLGRANAELGGAYYRRAEATLRQAFTTDKNLLKSQYDLRGFLGDDRLQTVQKDLSDLVQNRDKDTGAAVLLAYVYYNTGNERRAQALLDLADKRAGGRDALVKAMKAGWTFAGADETK
ncbi:MAG TPA: hypothetical protein VF595_17455 [Tepidisphaeraceae bacterium]|jgi:tetratricopeptide (TPR) repeat protein